MLRFILFFWLLILLPAMSDCAESFNPIPSIPRIRILISEGKSSATINGTGLIVGNLKGQKLFQTSQSAHFQAQGKYLVINQKRLGTSLVYIRSMDGRTQFDGTDYPGRLIVSVDAENDLSIVNEVQVEEYLKSVIGLEMGKDAPSES